MHSFFECAHLQKEQSARQKEMLNFQYLQRKRTLTFSEMPRDQKYLKKFAEEFRAHGISEAQIELNKVNREERDSRKKTRMNKQEMDASFSCSLLTQLV
jgi:hypothetical protein